MYLNHSFQNNQVPTFSKSVESLSRNRDLNITQNWYVHAKYGGLEAAGDVTYGQNAKDVKGYTGNFFSCLLE